MSDTSLNPSLGNLSLESFVVMKDILKESSTPNSSGGPNEKQELRRNGVTCGKKASNSALCSKECKASNVRHIELVEGTRKCVICNLQCTCHLPNDKVIMSDKESDQQRPSPINRKRQVDRSDSDDENSDERCTTSKADAFYKEKLRKRKQLPAKCRLRNYSAGTREIHDKYSQWTPDNLPARNELSDTCKPAKNTIENESATLEIQIRNIRSVHDQNSDSSPHRTPPQEIEVNKPFLIDPKFLDDGENSCDNKVANSCAQCAARDNFMQNGLDRSDSSEPESRPTSRSSHRTDHLQQDATFLGRSPTIEDDFKRSFFFPQNSEIYRLHCEEIKSRIAVNQAKLMLFESELEKSKLERKLLLNKN